MNHYDGRKPEPPYVTDIEQLALDERERCANLVETMEWNLNVRDWIDLSKKQITEKIARDLAEAIRNQ